MPQWVEHFQTEPCNVGRLPSFDEGSVPEILRSRTFRCRFRAQRERCPGTGGLFTVGDCRNLRRKPSFSWHLFSFTSTATHSPRSISLALKIESNRSRDRFLFCFHISLFLSLSLSLSLSLLFLVLAKGRAAIVFARVCFGSIVSRLRLPEPRPPARLFRRDLWLAGRRFIDRKSAGRIKKNRQNFFCFVFCGPFWAVHSKDGADEDPSRLSVVFFN